MNRTRAGTFNGFGSHPTTTARQAASVLWKIKYSSSLLFITEGFFSAQSLRLNYWTQVCCPEFSSTEPLSFHETIHVEESAQCERQSMAPGEAGPTVFCNYRSSQQLSLYKGEPSIWSQAESSPPFCQCSFPQGKRIHAILEVLPWSFQWVFFHIRPEKTKCQHSQHSELLLPSCHQAFYSTSHRTEWTNCRAATAPPMGTAGAEDGVRAPCADQQSCICMKEKFLPRWDLSDRTDSKAVAFRTWE